MLVRFWNSTARKHLETEWGLTFSDDDDNKKKKSQKRQGKEEKKKKSDAMEEEENGEEKSDKKESRKKKASVKSKPNRKRKRDGKDEKDEKDEKQREKRPRTRPKTLVAADLAALEARDHEVIDENKLSALHALLPAQLKCGASKKDTLLHAHGVYKGPYDSIKAGDVQKLKLTLGRTDHFLHVGIRTPTVVLGREEQHQNRWWLIFQQLAPVSKSEWKEGKASDGSAVVDRASTGLNVLGHITLEQLCKFEVVRDAVLALSMRAVLEPPCGDTHLQNLLLVAHKDVWNVDFEEIRGGFPKTGTGNLFEWIFSSVVAVKKREGMRDTMRANREQMQQAWDAWLIKLKSLPVDAYSASRLDDLQRAFRICFE
jgi:hypothetical protein